MNYEVVSNCASDVLIEYLNHLYRYAMILTRDKFEAEELVQETYVRAVRALGNLRPDSNIKGWLYTIMRNAWINRRRTLNNAPQMVSIDVHDVSSDSNTDNSYAIFRRKEESERLHEAILQLPAYCREVILLREFDELSYQEIADLLNCPIGTVMSRLARARSRLRTLLLSIKSSVSRNEERRATG